MIKLDLKGKKLLYWLDQNSRMSNKELAKEVGLSERGLAYKLEALEKEGIIKKHIAFINTLAIGYQHYKVLLKLQNTSIEKEELLLKRIVSASNVRFAANCEGSWDINLSIVAKTNEEFVRIYQQIERKAENAIAEKMVHLVVKAPGFTKGYLLGQNSMQMKVYEKLEKPANLDELDYRILKELSQNARITLVDLAKKLGKTIDVIRYRIRKLEKEDVISGYSIMVDHEKLGVKRTAVYFSMNNMTPEIEKQMYGFAQAHNIFAFVVTMIGKYDFSLEFEAPIEIGIESVLRAFRKRFADNIKDFEIIQTTREHKLDFYPF